MRHHVPDAKTQQQQQASFLASIQHQTTIVKDVHTSVIPSATVIKQEDFGLIEQSILTKGQHHSSINNCIISMNSNGQYQIKQSHPRIMVKDQVKTMSPLMFSPSQPVVTTIGSVNNSSIQSKWQNRLKSRIKVNSAPLFLVVGVYSQVPVGSEKKIIIKNEPSAVVSFADTTKQLLETTAFADSNLNSSML